MKYCPNCGGSLETETRYCPHCGFDLAPASTDSGNAATSSAAPKSVPEAAPAATTKNAERLATFQSMSKNYFGWLMSSIKHPTADEAGAKYFGLVSMGVSALLLTLAFVFPVNSLLGSSDHLSLGVDLQLFIGFLIANFIFVGVGFGSSVMGTKLDKIGFLVYTNRFAHITNVGLIGDLLFLIGMMMIPSANSTNVFAFPTWIALLIFGIWITGFLFSVSWSIKVAVMDRYYVLLIALIVLLFVISIYLSVQFSMLKSEVLGRIANGLSGQLLRSLTGGTY